MGTVPVLHTRDADQSTLRLCCHGEDLLRVFWATLPWIMRLDAGRVGSPSDSVVWWSTHTPASVRQASWWNWLIVSRIPSQDPPSASMFKGGCRR